MSRKKRDSLRKNLQKKKELRKRALLICVVGVVTALFIIAVRQIFALFDLFPYELRIVDTLIYFLTLVVCFLIAPQFMGYLRLSREIKELEMELAD